MPLHKTAAQRPTHRAALPCDTGCAQSVGIRLDAWLLQETERRRRCGIRSLERMQTICKRMREYAPDATFEAVDKPFVAGFVDYLRHTYRKSDGQPLAPSTLYATVSLLQTLLDRAVGEGLLARNPCRCLDPSERPRPGRAHPRAWLTVDELKRLIATPCRDPAVKRIFLFGCFTGLRISDLRRLRWGDLSGSETHGELLLQLQKTGRTLCLPLARQAMKWLPARGRQPTHAPLFPRVPRDLNACIGEWTRAAGITKHLTQHCARHTFATLLLTLGVDLYTVSKLLGHASPHHTQRYARIVDRQQEAAVRLADRAFP